MILLGLNTAEIKKIAKENHMDESYLVNTLVNEYELILGRYNEAITGNYAEPKFSNVRLLEDGVHVDVDLGSLPQAAKACNVLKEHGTSLQTVFEIFIQKGTKDFNFFKGYADWQDHQISEFLYAMVAAGFNSLMGFPLTSDTIEAWQFHCVLKATSKNCYNIKP